MSGCEGCIESHHSVNIDTDYSHIKEDQLQYGFYNIPSLSEKNPETGEHFNSPNSPKCEIRPIEPNCWHLLLL